MAVSSLRRAVMLGAVCVVLLLPARALAEELLPDAVGGLPGIYIGGMVDVNINVGEPLPLATPTDLDEPITLTGVENADPLRSIIFSMTDTIDADVDRIICIFNKTDSYFTGTAQNACVPLDCIWNRGDIDTGRRGVYRMKARLSVPDEYAGRYILPDELSEAVLLAYVSDPDTDFDICLSSASPAEYYFSWLIDIENDGPYTTWIAVDGGEWQRADYPLLSYSDSYAFSLSPSCFFEDGKTYSVCISTASRKSNVVSFVHHTGAMLNAEDIGGDRGGDDRDEQELPDIIQDVPDNGGLLGQNGASNELTPPDAPVITLPEAGGDFVQAQAPAELMPSAPVTPSVAIPSADLQAQQTPAQAQTQLSDAAPVLDKPSEPAKAYELSTATETTVSGIRLNEMLAANPTSIQFEKKGISIAIPSDFVAGLNVADGSLLTTTITPVGEYGFSVMLSVDGAPVDALPECRVSFPFPSGLGDGASCVDGSGNAVSYMVFNAEIGICTVTITKPGTYSVVVPDAPADARPVTAGIAGVSHLSGGSGESAANRALLSPVATAVAVAGGCAIIGGLSFVGVRTSHRRRGGK